MNATFYIPSGFIDKQYACCMAWWQADDLYRDGDEIGGMGRDQADLSQVHGDAPQDLAAKKQAVCDDRQRLAHLGYHPEGFAYPSGAFQVSAANGTENIEQLIAACGYRFARAVGGLSPTGPAYSETLPPRDRFAVRTGGVSSGAPIDLGAVQAAVSAAARHGGGLLPLVFNEICRAGSPNYAECMGTWRPIDDNTLGALLDWLARAGQPGGAPPGTLVETMRQALGLGRTPKLPARKTVVSITLDDGDLSQYLTLPPLRDHSMAATFYVPTGRTELSWAELRALAAAGNEIGGHTVDHINLTDAAVSDADKRKNICDDRHALVEHGFAAVSFAYPYGAYDRSAEGLVKSCGYLSARATGGASGSGNPRYAEESPPPDPYAIRTSTVANGPVELPELEAAVTGAARHGGGWVVLVFHQICVRGDSDFATCMQTFKPTELATFVSFLDWLKFGAPPGTVVKTVGQVIGGS